MDQLLWQHVGGGGGGVWGWGRGWGTGGGGGGHGDMYIHNYTLEGSLWQECTHTYIYIYIHIQPHSMAVFIWEFMCDERFVHGQLCNETKDVAVWIRVQVFMVLTWGPGEVVAVLLHLLIICSVAIWA